MLSGIWNKINISKLILLVVIKYWSIIGAEEMFKTSLKCSIVLKMGSIQTCRCIVLIVPCRNYSVHVEIKAQICSLLNLLEMCLSMTSSRQLASSHGSDAMQTLAAFIWSLHHEFGPSPVPRLELNVPSACINPPGASIHRMLSITNVCSWTCYPSRSHSGGLYCLWHAPPAQ